MLQAYFESLKYVGHLLPVSFLRIFLGYFYIQQAVFDWKAHVIGNSVVSDLLFEALSKPYMPSWYRYFLTEQLIPNWSLFAFILVGVQAAIGLSYLLGYVVRPISILALFLCFNYLAVSNVQQESLFRLLMASHVLLAWIGAGRCLGLDFYFYKRYRGMWW